MRNIKLYQFLPIFLATIACGCAGQNLITDNIPDTVPEIVTEHGDSVLKIVLLSDTAQTTFDQAQYSYVLESAAKGDFLDYYNGERVKECRQKKQKRCVIHVSGFATAFLAEDGQSLWTVRHAFDPVFDESKQKKIILERPQILLYDKFKNLIFDTRKAGDKAEFAFLGDPKTMREFSLKEFRDALSSDPKHDLQHWPEETRNGLAGKLTDLVKIRLNRPLNLPVLKFAAKIPIANDRVFLLGYPSRSQRQATFSAHYYDGHSFHVSSGHASTAFKMFHKIFDSYKQTEASDNKIFHLFEKYFYYHDAPSAEGFSGGPILDENGDIVSIQSSGTEEGGFGLQPAWISSLMRQFITPSQKTIKNQ